MGSTASKPPKTPSTFSRIASKRTSKRIFKQNSAVYPLAVPCDKKSENIENNNNSMQSLKPLNIEEEAVVVIRKKHNDEVSDDSSHIISRRNSKKEKKKRKSEAAPSGDDIISTYHQTNICYYQVENGKYLKLPNDTKHKSNDGCFIKMSNGSFRHVMVPDGSGSHQSMIVQTKDVRQSMPVQKISEKGKAKNDNKQQENRRVMVTMIDGGLPVVAVSKRDKTSNHLKKEKDKLKVTSADLQEEKKNV